MKLIINGNKEEHQVNNIAELVTSKDLDESGLVVEHNKKIVKEDHWNQKQLEEGDKIELISFVGGG